MSDQEPRKFISEAEMRRNKIDDELSSLLEEMMETEDMVEEEEIEPESLEALKKAASNICYLRKYYDVSNDKIIYFPSLVKTIINYSLFEEAEKFYFDEEDEFPQDYSIALRSVAFEREENEGDDSDNGMDDELMGRLSMSVQLTARDQDEMRAAIEQAEQEDTEAADDDDDLQVVPENDDEDEGSSSEDEEDAMNLISEAEMRQQMIDNELGKLLKKMMETEDMVEEEEIEPESLEALKAAANNICYLRKYYDVSNDKIIYFPSLLKTVINYTLFEEAEKFYFDEDDEFPQDYSIALRSVAFEQEEKEGDDGDNGMDDDMMERLSMMVQLTANDQDELKAAMEQAELEDTEAGAEEELATVEEKEAELSSDEDEYTKKADVDDEDRIVSETESQLEEPQAHVGSSIPETEPNLSPDESVVQVTSLPLQETNVLSTMALCSTVLAMYYTVFNVFPYGTFMVMDLVPGVNEETVGSYSGFLTSSFMVGWAMSSYLWGKIADMYGRKFVLISSLGLSALLAIVFGCSTSLTMAITSRFFMGLSNGVMVAAKTSISELAKGNKELESKGVGLLMSMVGYGMLLSPLIGGLTSDPKKQYPDSWTLLIFEKYPYLAPNLVSSLLSVLSLLFVVLKVEETLPVDMIRDYRLMGQDLIDSLRQTHASDSNFQTGSNTTKSDDDWEDELKVLESKEFSEVASLMSTGEARASFSSVMHRSSMLSPLPADERNLTVHRQHDTNTAVIIPKELVDPETATETTPLTQSAGKRTAQMTAQEILSNESTRMFLASYWANTFTSMAHNEAFPLFAMSLVGGLGMKECAIGAIAFGGGLVYCVGQYFIFSAAMKYFGLIKSLQYGSLVANVPVFLMPFSTFLVGPIQSVYLSLVIGGMMIGNSVFCGSVTIASNRSVDVGQRATLNGLASVGAGVARAFGPIFAGYLVSGSMTAAARLGGWLVYVALAIVGSGAFATTMFIPFAVEEE